MLPTEYTENFQVYRHDGDCYGCVQPATMLRYAQQIAGEHAIALGLDDALYARTHTAYVLVKQALRFDRVPRVDEHLTLITKPEALKRAVNKRITQVLDAEGRQAALVDSRWVLIDTDKRAILRRHPEEFASAHWAEIVEQELPMKLDRVPPEACETVGERTATYSQCDMNGHMNNARYVDAVCDALPPEVLDRCFVRELVIYYHKEVPRGGQYTLLRANPGGNYWYFAGLQEGKCCFETGLWMDERAKAEEVTNP